MIQVQRLKDNKLVTGNKQLLDEWLTNKSGFIWIDISDEDDDAERNILTRLHCSTHAIEDAQRHRHPPKFEKFSEHVFLLYRGIHKLGKDLDHDMQTVSLFIGENFLISLHKKSSLDIDHVSCAANLGELICSPARLASAILNYTASLYTESILEVEASLSELEELMSTKSSDALLMDVLFYRTTLRRFRRSCAYHEKMMGSFVKEQQTKINNPLALHDTQDAYDKFERLLSLSSLYYDLCGDLSDGYVSLTSHRLNKAIGILTVITVIFAPITFIAGIYGMNFEYMPELTFKFSYPIVLLVMLSISLSLLYFFKKKNWL